MTEEKKAEETQTPQAPVAQPEEIDFDRIKNGDEEYTKQVNDRLAKEASEEPAPAQETPAGEVPAAEAPKPEEDFFNFDDGDPIYRGSPFKVKKAELKALVQKGRHLEMRLSEVSPILQAAQFVQNTSPELAEAITRAAHDPTGAEQLKRIGEALRTGKVTQQVEDDLSDLNLPGLNSDDVRSVARIQMALDQRREAKRREQEQQQIQQEVAKRDQAASALVTGLRAVEGPTFDQVRPLMQQRLQQLRGAADQGIISEQDFNQFVIGLTDPNAVDDTGQPLFVRFYKDTKAEMLGTPSAPAPPAAPRGAPTNNTRLSPGSATAPTRSGDAGLDWKSMSQSEFDKRIAEKLAAL